MSLTTTTAEAVDDAVYYAFFRIVEIDEYAGPEAALEWARSVLEDRQLREAFARQIRRHLDGQPVR